MSRAIAMLNKKSSACALMKLTRSFACEQARMLSADTATEHFLSMHLPRNCLEIV